jgi:hypothetical protein
METIKANENNSSTIQVNTVHYNFDTYVNLPRWNSYWHQIVEAVILKPQTVLIIGIGDNIVGKILQKQNIKVYTFDFDKELNPDFIGNVTEICDVLQEKHFDVILCCQVLEHFPYDKFESTLQKLKQVADNVIISLPYSPIKFMINISLPYIGNRIITLDIPRFYKKFKFNGEHHWEIGQKGYGKRKIEYSIRKIFNIQKQFVVPYNHYHIFFILKNQNE